MVLAAENALNSPPEEMRLYKRECQYQGCIKIVKSAELTGISDYKHLYLHLHLHLFTFVYIYELEP